MLDALLAIRGINPAI